MFKLFVSHNFEFRSARFRTYLERSFTHRLNPSSKSRERMQHLLCNTGQLKHLAPLSRLLSSALVLKLLVYWNLRF